MVMISVARLWAFAFMIVAVLAITSDLTSPTSELVARSLEVRTSDKKKEECKYFFLQVVVKGKRYQKPAWLTISGGDAHVTKDPKKAAIFYINKKGQLIVCDKYTTLEFSNGYAVWKVGKKATSTVEYVWKKSFLEITGKKFKKGHEGRVCVSEDNSVFVEAECETPFKCLDIALMPVCARWADGTLYNGELEKGEEPCDVPDYTKPPKTEEPCEEDKPEKPVKEEEPCDDLDDLPEEPCDDDKPSKPTKPSKPSKEEPCEDDKPSKPSKPSKSEPCEDDKPSKTKEPCPDPSSDPDKSKRDVPEQSFEEEE